MKELFGPRGDKRENGLPRHIRIRRGTADDEFPTFEAMRRTMNQEMNWAHHAATRHHLRNGPDSSFWLAEESSLFSTTKVIGYARSMVRDGVWCLNEFFVLPGHQRQGVGGALLNACLHDGDEAGAHTRLVLASHHPAADSLYVRRAGCFPRLPMLLIVGAVSKLTPPESGDVTIHESALPRPFPGRCAPGRSLLSEPILPSPELTAELDALDRDIIGYARPVEHAFWIGAMGGAGRSSRLFREAAPPGEKGRLVGYVYTGYETNGPALAMEPEDLPRFIYHVVTLVRRLPQAGGEFEFRPAELYFPLCGSNEVMLSWLLGCGWHIAFQYLFMSSRPLGRLDRYVCHSPLYCL